MPEHLMTYLRFTFSLSEMYSRGADMYDARLEHNEWIGNPAMGIS